jgi:adenosylhomocysteinase
VFIGCRRCLPRAIDSFHAINVIDCVTKSKFGKAHGYRHPLSDGIMRNADAKIGGKRAFIYGYGDVSKSAPSDARC